MKKVRIVLILLVDILSFKLKYAVSEERSVTIESIKHGNIIFYLGKSLTKFDLAKENACENGSLASIDTLEKTDLVKAFSQFDGVDESTIFYFGNNNHQAIPSKYQIIHFKHCRPAQKIIKSVAICKRKSTFTISPARAISRCQ